MAVLPPLIELTPLYGVGLSPLPDTVALLGSRFFDMGSFLEVSARGLTLLPAVSIVASSGF